MPMIEYYPQIKWVHVVAVLASGSLFALRGLLVVAGRQRVALRAPLRYLSYSIDVTLLAAAILLMPLVHQYPLIHTWLTVKLALLVIYIVLGSFALKRGGTRRLRAVCFVLALALFGFIMTIARAHDPLGLLRPWFA